MQHNSMGQMNDYLNQSKRKIRRRRVFSALSAAVVLGVVVNLMEPASTLTREVICGLEEHTHAEACYADGALICSLPEHAHTEDCYALTRSEAELLAETPESTQDELPGELTAEAVDDEVGEAQDVELTDTEEQTSVGNDETDDTFIPDENLDPLEAYIITEAGTVSAGEPIDLELVHFGGMEPVRRALLVWQGEDTLIDEANAEETVAITPETDETVQIALVVIDANGESVTAEWTIPGAELEKQTEVDKTADEEQTEVENDDPEEQDEVEYENAIESDTEEDVTEEPDREEAVDVETENTDAADEKEAAPEAEEAIEETVEETAEEEDTAEEDTAEETAAEETAAEENTEEGNTEEEIGEEADTDEEVNEAETDAEADVEDVEEEKEAGEEEPAAGLLTFEGEDFTVTLKWNEVLSGDAALLVREIDADSEDYVASLAAAEAALNPSKAEEEAPAEEIVEEIESTGSIEETETPDEASGDESAEQETGEEEAGEETGETVKLNARFFTVAVAQGDEISVPAGGEITVVSTNEGAMLVRIVDGAAHTGDGIFADYQGEALGIVTVEAMETSAEPEPAAEEPAAEEPTEEPGEEPLEEPADEAAEPDCEAGALVATGEGYTVTMTYEADAQIPADAALAVREIPFGTPEYAEYFNQAGDALSENWDEATALPRFFDITILYNEEEIQPAAAVSVQIALDEAVSVSADDEMRAIHFAEDAAQVLEAVSEQSAAEGPLPEAAEAVSFDAESFSVYGIVPTATITKKVITADGETFEIHVTYGKEAEIPEGARLTAEEITAESDPETYNTYTALSARALTGDADAALKLARLFDIAIVDAEGAKIEPGDTVSVEIRMANAQDDETVFDESGELAVSVADAPVSEQDDVDFGADDLPAETAEAPGTEGEAAETEPQPIQVVHFITGDEAQVITPEASADAETGADVVSFETGSFSLYSVVQLENINAQRDPYGLNGKSFAIINTYGNAALNKRNDVAEVGIQLDVAYDIFNKTYSDQNLVTWTFTANDDGTYKLHTIIGEQKYYIKMNQYNEWGPEVTTEENDAAHITVQPTPSGSVALCVVNYNGSNQNRYLTTVTVNDRIILRNVDRGAPTANDQFVLCTYKGNNTSIAYQTYAIVQKDESDYGRGPYNAFDNGHGHSAQVITDTIGFVYYTKGATSADLMSSTLNGDWPTSTKDGNKSLSTLFKDGTAVTNTMFIKSIHDATGYYEYSAFDNFAHLNGSSFEVYEEIGAPHSEEDHFFYNRGNFLPYNDLARDSYSRNVNQFDENGEQINMSDPTLGKELYTLAEDTDYYFGMTIDAPFQQPKDGVLYNGEPIVLEFNGDDDMWVYIDDVLVLDIGGDHDAISGSINFTTGEVKVNSTNFNNVYSDYLTGDNKLTIQEMFQRAGKDVNTGFKNGTFADYTTHKLRLFYMERGAAASNLHIKFNLQTVTPGALTLKKELDEDVSTKYGPNPEKVYYFQVFKNGDTSPLGASDINDSDSAGTALKSAKIGEVDATPGTVTIGGVEYSNVFTLKANDELVLISRDVTQKFYFKEISADMYNVEINGATAADTEDEQNYVYKSTAFGSDGVIVTYKNGGRKGELQITKALREGDEAYYNNEGFEFQVALQDPTKTASDIVAFPENGSAPTGYLWYADGPYGIMDASGKYLIKNSQGTSETYVVYDNASAVGKIENIKPGQTVVIPNLLQGTRFLVRETKMSGKYEGVSVAVGDAVQTGTNLLAQGTIPDEPGKLTTAELVTITNGVRKAKIVLKKTNDTGDALEGAEFNLKYKKAGVEGSFQTFETEPVNGQRVAKAYKPINGSESGEAKVDINGLPRGMIYELVETRAPDGFIILNKPVYFSIADNGTVALCDETGSTTGENDQPISYDNITLNVSEISITVKNTPGARLPATGGMGTLPFTIGGLALILCAAMIMVLRRKDNY